MVSVLNDPDWEKLLDLGLRGAAGGPHGPQTPFFGTLCMRRKVRDGLEVIFGPTALPPPPQSNFSIQIDEFPSDSMDFPIVYRCGAAYSGRLGQIPKIAICDDFQTPTKKL